MFSVFGYFALLTPLLFLVIIALCVLTIWRAVTRPWRARAAPACERCGYAVVGLVSFECPECGGDLREIGIITPGMETKRRGSLAGALLAWTFLCLLVAGIAISLGSYLSVFGGQRTAPLQWSQWFTPNSGAYAQVEMELDTPSGFGTLDTIGLTLTHADKSTSVLTIDASTQTYTVDTPNAGEIAAVWGTDTIERWFTSVGLDTADESVKSEASELARYTDAILFQKHPLSSVNLNNFTSGQMTVTQWTGAIVSGNILGELLLAFSSLAIGLLLYILGIVWIVHRRLRPVREAKLPRKPAPPISPS